MDDSPPGCAGPAAAVQSVDDSEGDPPPGAEGLEPDDADCDAPRSPRERSPPGWSPPDEPAAAVQSVDGSPPDCEGIPPDAECGDHDEPGSSKGGSPPGWAGPAGALQSVDGSEGDLPSPGDRSPPDRTPPDGPAAAQSVSVSDVDSPPGAGGTGPDAERGDHDGPCSPEDGSPPGWAGPADAVQSVDGSGGEFSPGAEGPEPEDAGCGAPRSPEGGSPLGGTPPDEPAAAVQSLDGSDAGPPLDGEGAPPGVERGDHDRPRSPEDGSPLGWGGPVLDLQSADGSVGDPPPGADGPEPDDADCEAPCSPGDRPPAD